MNERTSLFQRQQPKEETDMGVTLKEENVLDEWSMLIDNAADSSDDLLDDIQNRLEQAQIPGGCRWSLEEVKSSTWVARVKREFLIVKLDQFSDYRIYIAAREYGRHLDVCRFTTVEPGFFKKKLAEHLTGGEGAALSAPKNILIEQDLKAWVSVVHHAVLDAVGALVKKLGQDPTRIRRESQGYLSVW